MKYTIGYDIGIASVGWAVKNNETNELVDFGVRKFEEATKAEEVRVNRSARRTIRRRKWRLNQLKKAYINFNIEDLNKLTEEEFNDYKHFKFAESKVPTIYHLRKKALSEEVTSRELYQVLHNICRTRGHFYMEDVDYSKESITLDMFVGKFLDFAANYIEISQEEKLIDEQLKLLYNGENKTRTIKNLGTICLDENDNKWLLECIKILSGNKAKIGILNQDFETKEKTSKNISNLKNEENLSEILQELIQMYDMLGVSKFMKEYSYLCEKHVDAIDEYQEYNKFDKNSAEYKCFASKYKELNKKKLRVVKNIGNNYPNGLYVKEINAILKAQAKYNEKITEEFIVVVNEIVKAKIPYWMGPLNSHEKTKNNWMEKVSSEKVDYSYNYSKKLFDESKSQIQWKNNLIGNCTYLPKEKVMVKNSFINELHSVLNEINILTAQVNDENYYLTSEDKQRIIENLFLETKENVSFDQVKTELNLDYYGVKLTSKTNRRKFNTKFTMYHQVVQIIPSLAIKSLVKELAKLQNNDETSKIRKIEEIITNVCILEDEASKYNYFIEKYDVEITERLAKLNCVDFGKFSEKFMIKTPLNENGESLIDILLLDNTMDYVNEQQTIIANACDENGNLINLASNKYEKLLKENNKLSYDLLVNNNKLMFPISRGVLRSLNETMKIHNAILNQFDGIHPEKVVIETARDLGDPKQGEAAKHFDEMKKLYESVVAQTKDGSLDNWENIEEYLIKNRRKIELYLRQNGRDMISGKVINLNNLSQYQIDHILPRGFGDNSMDNLMLIDGKINSLKDNRTAIEFLRDTNNNYNEEIFIENVNRLKEMKLISENKQKRLLLETTTEAIGFVQRNLVDTRYIIKEFTSILSAYNKVNNLDMEIVSLQGTFNGIFRKSLNFPKSRNLGEQHHAEDAGIIIIVDQCLNELYPGYNKEIRTNNENYQKYQQKVRENYQNFIKTMTINEEGNKDKAVTTIRYMFKKAYGVNFQDDTYLNELKSRTPLLSWREKRNYRGQFFEQTIQKQGKGSDDAPLSVLNINNSKAKYNGVEFHCIDLYKMTAGKKKKHFAIHVPKVIINANGEINQKAYLNLVENCYKYNELIDDNGNLIEGAFRIRLFKDQLVYNTEFNEVVRFSAGTMANKKLEYKLPNISNFKQVNSIRQEIIELLKNDISNPLDFTKPRYNLKELNFPILAKYLIVNIPNHHGCFQEKTELEQLISMSTLEKVSKDDEKMYGQILNVLHGLYKLLKDSEKTLWEIIEYIIGYINAADTNYQIAAIKGQLSKGINNLKDEDAQYAKIITSPLGVRFTNTENGKLRLSCFKMKNGKKDFKVVKKERFSWQV